MAKTGKTRGLGDPAPVWTPEPADLDHDIDDLSDAELEKIRKSAHPEGDPAKRIKRVG